LKLELGLACVSNCIRIQEASPVAQTQLYEPRSEAANS